jgi:hypothetical protein
MAKPIRNTLNLDTPSWGLADARRAAGQIVTAPELFKPFLCALFSADPRLRHHAADTARRIAEKQSELLSPYADRLLGLFSEIGPKEAGDNWRTRAHLGLVVARIAHSRAQRLRATGLLMPLYYDPSNVVRCTAIEGLGLLAYRAPSLRPQVEPLLEEALATGTLAMRCRARDALRRWLTERPHDGLAQNRTSSP